MINGLFFDLFGTLLEYGDMRKAWNNWVMEFHKLLTPHGLNISREEFAPHCNQFFSKDAPATELDGMTVYEYRINRLCKKLNINLDMKHICQTATLTANVWQKEITLASDCIETLQILGKNKKIALITNYDHPPHIDSILSHYDIRQYFDEVVISARVGYKKPDPEIFKIALKRTSLNAKEVIYVGDTEDDINGALASGIRPILINNIDKDQSAFDYHHGKIPDQNNSTSNNLNILTIPKLSNLTEKFQ